MECSAQEVQQLLMGYDNIMLTAHVSPDGDAVGSLAALSEWLQREGKRVCVVLDDDVDDKFSFLEQTGSFLRPDQVRTDGTWLSVVLDATDRSRVGAAASVMTGKVLNIDHHISNSHFADWEYIRPGCAAAGEILTDLFSAWGVRITPSMANALYTAVATDCGFFKFSNTTGNTLRAAALLVDAGAQPHVVSEHLEAYTMEKLRALSEVLRRVELFGGRRIAALSFTPEVLKYTGEHTGSYIDYIRKLRRVDAAFTVKYIGPEETRVSLRSKSADVNAVAAVFGGGGHVKAAGCTIYRPLNEAKKMVVKELLNVL